MAVVCTETLDSHQALLHATIDPSSSHSLNLPKDYKFSKCVLPQCYAKWADRFTNFQVRADDTWVVSLPKCGSLWVQNIVWQLRNNLDFTVGAINPMEQFFENVLFEPGENEMLQKHAEKLCRQFNEYDNISSPRFFKSHLPAYLLPKDLWTVKPKIIYMARDPKDSAVSRFYQAQKHALFEKRPLIKKEDFFEQVLNDQLSFSPYHDHVLSFWQLRHLDHVLFMSYEELSADQFGGIKRISEFLGCSYDDGQLRTLVDHVSFDSLKKNFPLTSQFPYVIDKTLKQDPNLSHCRKGKVGGYRDEMSEDFIKRFDECTEDKLIDSDFKYAFVKMYPTQETKPFDQM